MSSMHSIFNNRAPMTGPVCTPPKPSLKEEQLQFVVHELGHRIKNLLAVVQALANQTAQRSATVEEFRTVFSERLQGLSRSLDLLVQEDGRGATIADLVRSQLGPFGEIDGIRIAATGPVVSLNPEATQHIGLALHELATNATKHGALSVPSGAVTVDWEIVPSELGPSRFRLNWHEHHGPRVMSPQRRGFGHVVLQRMTGRALQGKVSHEFGVSGVSWTLDVPAAAVVMQSRSEIPIAVVSEVRGAVAARGHVSLWRRHLPGLRENPETSHHAKMRPVHALVFPPERHAATLSLSKGGNLGDGRKRSEIMTCQMPNAESRSLAIRS